MSKPFKIFMLIIFLILGAFALEMMKDTQEKEVAARKFSVEVTPEQSKNKNLVAALNHLLNACPKLQEYSPDFGKATVQENTGYYFFNENSGMQLTFKISDNPQYLPAPLNTRSAGHTCAFDINGTGTVASVAKDECKSLCQGEWIDGNGENMQIVLADKSVKHVPAKTEAAAPVVSKTVADQEQYSQLLRLISVDTSSFDESYSTFMALMDEVRKGKSMQAVQAEMEEPVAQMLYAASRLQTRSALVSKIKNEDAKKHINEGLNTTIEIYASKYVFAKDARAAISIGTGAAIQAALQKNGERMKQLQTDMLKAGLHFIEAKKSLGMPAELPELGGAK